MHEFKTYHPVINFIYFVCTIGFGMFYMHPICFVISFVCSFACSAVLRGKKATQKNAVSMLLVLLVSAVLNPVFNHEGATILAYFPNGNPLTLESVFYGLAAGGMLASVLCWFSCCNAVMTSDKLLYLSGRILPSLSLLFSMTLRFVPRFAAQCRAVAQAQKCIGHDAASGNIVMRAKHGLSILSCMVTWSLENAIDTADSMKSRGYGLPGRTAFSIYRFDKRDAVSLCWILGLGVYVLIGGLSGAVGFYYFPVVNAVTLAPYNISVFTAYLALCILPVLIEVWEVKKWKSIQSNI